jgi:hypothetical protein
MEKADEDGTGRLEEASNSTALSSGAVPTNQALKNYKLLFCP